MWATALILGFAGSMHCMGMCAPLVIAVTNAKSVFSRLIYNTGRVLTYGIMGAIVAGAGMILPLHRYQNALSIALGIALLVIGLGGFRSIRIPILTRYIHGLTIRLKSLFGHYLTRNTRGSIFILGVLNGMLPCGLTLIALTWCVTLKGPLDGLNFMLLFGVGTAPVMLGLTGVLPFLVKKTRWSLQKLTTSMLIASGFLLIARVFIVHVPHSDHAGLIDIILCR